MMRHYFYELADYICGKKREGEVFLVNLEGETSDFVRFNHGRIRQSGTVTQYYFSVKLILGLKHISKTTYLTADKAQDRQRVDALIEQLRGTVTFLADDPFLLYATEERSGETINPNMLPPAEEIVNVIIDEAKGLDFTGILASGTMVTGFSNSFGQKNWHEQSNFNLDWSVYHLRDKAVKSGYAGMKWDRSLFGEKMRSVRDQLEFMKRDPKTISPGKYRVYLSPAAVDDFLQITGWGGFGLKSHRTKNASLLKMSEGEIAMSPMVTVLENTKDGIAPDFQGSGFRKPDQVTMIKNGKFNEFLISPRSSNEYGIPENGADEDEVPHSLEMAAGTLKEDEILSALGTGIYINNVHYLNYSDRPSARVTGMTRFACFWVENGVVDSPINVMRFDESLYRIFGENLLGLTEKREMKISSMTYEKRQSMSARVPGALVDNFEFTL